MATISSAPSATTFATTTPATWWLKNPLDPTKNTPIDATEWSPSKTTAAGVFYPRGRTTAVVASGDQWGWEGTLKSRCLSRTRYNVFLTLLNSKATLLLQDVLGRQWYVRVASDPREQIVEAAPVAGEITPLRFAVEIDVGLVEVAAP